MGRRPRREISSMIDPRPGATVDPSAPRPSRAERESGVAMDRAGKPSFMYFRQMAVVVRPGIPTLGLFALRGFGDRDNVPRTRHGANGIAPTRPRIRASGLETQDE